MLRLRDVLVVLLYGFQNVVTYFQRRTCRLLQPADNEVRRKVFGSKKDQVGYF